MSDGITRPKDLIIECHYCKKPIPAERHESYDYHNNCDDINYYPYPELKGVEWDYLGHNYVCKNCLDKKEKIILDDLLKEYSNHLDRMPGFRERLKREYDKEIEKCTQEENMLKLVIEELNKYIGINLKISNEVKEIISKEYRWENDLKKIFSVVEQSMNSASL